MSEISESEVTSTELKWPGKKTEVDRVNLPFQTVETINKPRIKEEALSFNNWPQNYPHEWKNKLIWGDNKYVMSSLLKDFAGKINLIYIDPPFATGADFTASVNVGNQEVTKEATIIEKKAYRDTWGIDVDGKWIRGIAPYLQMMYDRLVLMKELLADDGSIYVHLDWHVGHYVKLLLDEIFGRDNFRNEIVWAYTGPSRQTKDFPDKHDVLYRYSKGGDYKFNADAIRIPYKKLETGRTSGIFKKEATLSEEGKIPEDWWRDITPVARLHATELLGFPTQKPEALLARVIKASTDEGDLVADFFCGSGTTGAVAEKLNRRWIMSDLSKFAIQTTRKRLLNLHNYSKDYDQPARPFEVLNMGNYQKQKFIENGNYPPIEKYINFILELYRSTPISGFSFIHGEKGRNFIHVAGVDSIVTEREVRDAVEECVEAGGKAIDILGWDFEMGLDEVVDRISDEYETQVKLVQIPKEAMELKSASRNIRFFDMNYLEVNHKIKSKKLKLELKDFVIANREYLPDEVEENIESFADYIDYWAVDFNYKEDTFHNMWQSFRTRKSKKLDTKCSHRYEEEGIYNVLIKVIDIFGNDTNKLLEVEVN